LKLVKATYAAVIGTLPPSRLLPRGLKKFFRVAAI
jgi:hypothetical protein